MADGRVEIVDTVGLDVVPQADNWGTKLRAAVLPDAERVGREVAARIAAPIGKKIADAIRDGVQEGGKLAAAAATKAGEKAGAEFARAARAKIEAALSKAFDATVNLDLDLSAAEARLKAFGAGTTVTVNVDLDDTAARAQLAALASSAGGLRDINVHVDLRGIGTALADTAALKRVLDALDGRSIGIHIDLRGHGAALADLGAVETVVNRLDGRAVNIHIDLRGHGSAIADLLALDTALHRLDGRTITIHLDIRPNISALIASLLALHTALNGLGSSASHNSSLFSNLFGSFSGRFGLITGMFSTIGKSIASAVSSTFEFAVAIGKLVVAWLSSAGAASIEAAATAAATAALGAMAAVVVGAAAGLLALAGAAVIAGAALTVIAGILSLVGVAAGLVPAAFGGIAFGAVALVTAMLPVVSVLQDYISGQDKLTQATQEVQHAHERAAEQIQSAAEAIQQAQRNEQYAQESLTKARKDAVRQLEDMALQVRGLGNDEEAARIRLARAQETLIKVNKDAKSTALDRREAVLGVKQAELALEQTLKDGQRTRADYIVAQRKGVEGSDQVVQAQRQVQDAHHATQKAVEQMAKAQTQAAFAIGNAQHQYDMAAQSWNLLTETGRQFVAFLKPLVDFLRNDVSKVAQDLMFPGFIAFLDAIKPYMKDHTFADTIGLVAAAIGDVGRQFATLYQGTAGRQFVNDLRDIAAAGADFVRSLGAGAVSLIRDLITGFADLARGSKPLTDAMGQFFGLVGDGLKRFFQALGDKATMKALSDIFWVLGKTIKDTLVVLGPVIAQLAQDFAPVFAQLEPVLVDFLRAVGKILTQMSQRGVMEAFVKVFDSLVQVMVRMTEGSPSMIEKLADAFTAIMLEIARLIESGDLDRLIKAFIDLTPQMVQLAHYATDLLITLGPLVDLFGGLAGISLFGLNAEMFLLSGYVDGLKVGLDGISHWFGTTLPNLLGNDVKKNGPGWTGFWKELKNEWNNWFAEPIGTWFGTTLPGYMTDTKKNGAGWSGFMRSLNNEVNNWLIQPIGNFFTTTFPQWFNTLNKLGPNIIDGFVSGLQSAVDRLWKWLDDTFGGGPNSLVSRIKRALGIASPSTVMAGIGRDLIDGLIAGIRDVIPGLHINVAGWLWDGPGSLLGRIKTGFGIAVKAGVSAAETTATIGRNLVQGLSDGFHSTIGAAHTSIVKKLGDIRDGMAGAFSPISGMFSNIFSNVQTATGTGVNKVAGVIDTWLGKVDAITGPFGIHLGRVGQITVLKAIPTSTQGLGPALQLHLASGGPVPGWSPSSTADNIPAWLTAREFVQPVDAVDYYGVSAMEALRKKKIPREQLAALNAAAGTGRIRPADIAGDGSEGIGFLPGFASGGQVRVPRFAGGGFAAPSLIPGVQSFIRAQNGKPYLWAQAGPRGYDCCIVKGVRVYGPDGAKPIQDVRAGDRVFSYVDGRLEAHTVTAAWQSIHQPVFAVRTRNRTVTASANHPFLRVVQVGHEPFEHREDADWLGLPERPGGSRKGVECSVSICAAPVFANGMCGKHQARWRKHGDPRITVSKRAKFGTEWARVDQLRRGDYLVQPRQMAAAAKPHPTLADGTAVDADVAWLVGAAVGDGTVTDKGLRLCLYGDKRDRATQIITDRWGSHPGHGESYGLVVSSVRLRDGLTALGMRVNGPDKRIPEAVWTWDAELQRAFLDGYCDADGHRPADQTKHGERTYHSASRELVEDVRALHIMLGDPASNIHVTKRTKPITIKGKLVKNARTQHAVTIWRRSGLGETRLRNNPGLAQWLDDGDFSLAPVLSIDPKGEEDTWDLTVEDAHNFVADGVVVHNSGIASAVYNLLVGRNPYNHTFSTDSFRGGTPGGFRSGTGTYTVGVSHPGESPASNSTGHMAGNLGGLAFESKGSKGVVLGGAARPVNIFRHLFYLPQLGGTYVPAGGGGGGSVVSFADQLKAAIAQGVAQITNVALPNFAGVQPDWLGQATGGISSQLKSAIIGKVRTAQSFTGLIRSVGGGGQGLGTATGSANIAALLLAQARSMGASNKVILSLFETALVETGMRNLANPTIPASLAYPHDGLSSDHDSLGIMQQRAGWGSVAERMNVSISARKYLAKAIARQGGYSSAGRLAQAVQVSAFPARYDARRGDAYAWLARLGANFPSGIFDQGGYLPKGLSIAINNTGRAERILNPTETARYDRGQRAGSVNMQIGNYFARDADIHATARELDWMLRGGGL